MKSVFAFLTVAFLATVSEAVSVRDFGAVGDGVHDDTLAIQKAADSLYARAPGSAFGEGKWQPKRDMWCLRDRYGTGTWDGPNGELFFPKGVYRITGPVMLYWSVNLRGEEGPVVRNERPDRDCFYFDHAFRSSVEGLAIEGGRRQLVFWTNNRSDSTLFVSRCVFRNAADVAMVSYCRRLKSDPVVNAAGRIEGRSPYVISRSAEGLVSLEPRDENQLASVPNSTLIVVEECSFEDNARAFDLSSDGVLVRDSRVRARADADGPAASVGCQAHIDNVRFELTGSMASTNRCVLQCGGHTMLVSGSAFTSEVPVPAIRYVGKPCSVRAGCQLRIKDLMLGNGGGPVIRFAAEAFPNLLVVDGLSRKDGGDVPQRIFDFERAPTAEEVSKWSANSKTLKSGWPHPVMAAEACLGVSAGRFDSRQFDASLPAALEPFRRPFDDVRCRFSSRLEIAVPTRTAEGAEVVVFGGRPTMNPKGDDGDDTEALLPAARQVSQKDGSVLVLPPNWLRTKKAIPLSGRMRVTVRGRAVLTADDAAPAFEVAEGSDIVFENVIFRRGRNAVRCLGKSGRLGFRNCTFCDQLEASVCSDVEQKTDWRIEVTGGSADTPHLYRGAAERMRIDGFWYTVAADRPVKSYAPSFAAIENLPGGKLEMRDVLGVPRYFEPDELYEWKCPAPKMTGDYRWIDNRGFLRVLQSRFGGERGGLTPFYAATGAVSYVEGAIASHYNRHLASQGASAVVTDSAKVTYVDVVGFNFEAQVHTTLRTRSASGEESVTQKGVFNCYPFDATQAVAPRHLRRFPRTLYFAEIPLNTTYGNGNIWAGWTGRWTDWPLMIDRSIPYIEGRHYRVTWPDLLRTLTEMKLGGMDAATYNVARRENGMLICAALARGEKLPVMTVPDYPPSKRADGYVTPDKEDEPWFAPSLFNKNGCFFEGKPIVTCYWTMLTNPRQIDERRAYIRRKYGDFWFVPDVGSVPTSRWKEKLGLGREITAADIEDAKGRIRTILRHADGVRISGYHQVTGVYDGERSFDADFFRRYAKPLVLEVYAEPEFKGKFLAMNVGMGHDNTYKGGQLSSSNGTKTLRDSISCALELAPDFITFFEWDEWNENTGIRPTLWNSFAPRRVVRAMKAEAEGRGPEAPLAGDDTSIPNIILSFRKTLALGESLRFEFLSVPDSAAKGTAVCHLTLKDENGTVLAKLPEVELDLAKMDERRVKWDTVLAGDACAVVPELEIEWNGKRRTWSEGLPFAEIRPSSNWDRKWVLMPLRDLVDGATCSVESAGFRDGTTRIRVKVDSPRTIDRLEVVDGGDIVYSMSGDERQAYCEDEDHYVFSSMNFCTPYTQKGATMSIEGVSDAEWMLGTNRTHGLRRKLFPQAEFTVDTYVRVLKREATNAVLKLDWPDIGKFEMPLRRVLENGVCSIAGTNGFCMGVHRFNRQAAFFAPVNAKRAESVADIVPDLPVSVIGGHAITADGKICRSKPIVVGARSGEKQAIRVWSEEQKRSVTVEVDRARLPRFAYDVSGKRTGTVAKSHYGWAYNGILGGSTAVATRRNRGGDSRQHCCTEKRMGMPTCAPTVTGEGRQAEMRFDGTGTYFVMPGGVIPTTCAYRFSFEFRPDDPEREQEIFGTGVGNPALWGVIGYLKLVDGGYVSGVGLSLHEYRDAHFRSKSRVKKGEWNKLELVSDAETLEMFLNGESAGKVKLVQPGRANSNCWFGGRPKELFKGSVRDVRVRHGW